MPTSAHGRCLVRRLIAAVLLQRRPPSVAESTDLQHDISLSAVSGCAKASGMEILVLADAWRDATLANKGRGIIVWGTESISL